MPLNKLQELALFAQNCTLEYWPLAGFVKMSHNEDCNSYNLRKYLPEIEIFFLLMISC